MPVMLAITLSSLSAFSPSLLPPLLSIYSPKISFQSPSCFLLIIIYLLKSFVGIRQAHGSLSLQEKVCSVLNYYVYGSHAQLSKKATPLIHVFVCIYMYVIQLLFWSSNLCTLPPHKFSLLNQILRQKLQFMYDIYYTWVYTCTCIHVLCTCSPVYMYLHAAQGVGIFLINKLSQLKKWSRESSKQTSWDNIIDVGA